MNITRRWRKFMALGCSHGALACPKALAAILKFKQSFKPDLTAHLGDAFDTTAFRSGARGTKDEAEPIDPDIASGLDFLEKLEPTVFLFGNHEDRLTSLASHPNAIVACCASKIVHEIKQACERMKCEVLEYNYRQAYQLGSFRLMHGTVYTEHAARDHAELHGNVIHAHCHRAMMATGRRSDAPVGVSVGCLMDPAKAGYAKNRKSTYAWSQGFAWGEYVDGGKTQVWLHVQPQGLSEWRLPS